MGDGIKYNLDLLESARVSATKAAGRVGTVGDDLGGVHVPARAFGTSPGAAAMSQAVTSLCSTATTQLGKGESVLRAVGRAVDGVMTAIEQADRNSKQSFDVGLGHTGGDVRNPAGGSTAPASAGGGSGSGSGSGDGGGGGAAGTKPGMAPPVDPGTGVMVNLPGKLGSVEAPNKTAAKAVRSALSQLGKPYVWGAESPGQGFDCSGLTSWSYKEAGKEIPRVAVDQTVGQKVSRDNLAPGDLVVFRDHVTMYIGEGKIVQAPQAGENVEVKDLYTDLGSDPFLGFFRPTA